MNTPQPTNRNASAEDHLYSWVDAVDHVHYLFIRHPEAHHISPKRQKWGRFVIRKLYEELEEQCAKSGYAAPELTLSDKGLAYAMEDTDDDGWGLLKGGPQQPQP